jgi:hypothetical protein
MEYLYKYLYHMGKFSYIYSRSKNRAFSCNKGGISNVNGKHEVARKFKTHYVKYMKSLKKQYAQWLYHEILSRSRLKPRLLKHADIDDNTTIGVYKATHGVSKGKFFAYRKFTDTYICSHGVTTSKEALRIKTAFNNLSCHAHGTEKDNIVDFERKNEENSLPKDKDDVDTDFNSNHSFSQSQYVRHQLMLTQDNNCNCCSEVLGHGFTSEHIIPIKFGGRDEAGNLQALCNNCNQFKNSIVDTHIEELWNFEKSYDKLDILMLQKSLFEQFNHKKIMHKNMTVPQKLVLSTKLSLSAIAKAFYWTFNTPKL